MAKKSWFNKNYQEKKTVNPNGTTETIEEYLKRGGTITSCVIAKQTPEVYNPLDKNEQAIPKTNEINELF